MRILVKSTKLGGRWVGARYECNARIFVAGHGDVVLAIGNSLLLPGREKEACLEILEATPMELNLLRRSDYHFSIAFT